MKKNTKVNATCKWCGVSLSPTHTGPCPKCGKEGKNITIILKDFVRIKDTFFEENPRIKWLSTAIGLGSPFLGWILSDLAGLIIGLVFAVIQHLLFPLASPKVREKIRMWRS